MRKLLYLRVLTFLTGGDWLTRSVIALLMSRRVSYIILEVAGTAMAELVKRKE